MKTRLHYLWDQLRTSYWFIPSIMGFGSILLAFIVVGLDREFIDDSFFNWTYAGSAEGARAVLSTIAGSMITVAGVVFSITIVALTLASSQFGPRLLRSFIRDRANQFVLGTFLATFLYCLIVLRTVRGGEDSAFVPEFAVTLGVVLAMLSLGVLIFFIHHVSIFMQVSTVITAVSEELEGLLESVFPRQLGREPDSQPMVPPICDEIASTIVTKKSGYFVAINSEYLFELIKEFDLTVKLLNRPGHFLIQGAKIAEVWAEKEVPGDLVERINASFVISSVRTTIQDAEFAIEQLVEIALRALSPGVNDPFTALLCIDRLGAALARLTDLNPPSRYRYDKEGRLRVIVNHVTSFPKILEAAFHPIRQAAASQVMVLIHLGEVLLVIAERAKRAEDRNALREQVNLIERAMNQHITEQIDQAEINDRLQQVRLVLDEANKNKLQ